MSNQAIPPETIIDITVDSALWKKHGQLDEKVRSAILMALGYANQDKESISGPCELSVVFSNDESVRLLNRDFRKIDKPTNVLSFPMNEGNDSMEGCLGDIVLAYETIEREAGEQDKSFSDHLVHLIVHGTLHLVGYDHMEEEEAEAMESLEVRILDKLGIKNPYSDENFMPY